MQHGRLFAASLIIIILSLVSQQPVSYNGITALNGRREANDFYKKIGYKSAEKWTYWQKG